MMASWDLGDQVSAFVQEVKMCSYTHLAESRTHLREALQVTRITLLDADGD